MENFRSLADEMKSSGGGIEVGDAGGLLREITGLLGDPEKRQSAGEKAYGVAVRDGAVLERSLDLLRPYLDFGLGRDVPARNRGIAAVYE